HNPLEPPLLPYPRLFRSALADARCRRPADPFHRAVERRLPPLLPCPADRRDRRVLPRLCRAASRTPGALPGRGLRLSGRVLGARSDEHTSELQSLTQLVC